MSKERALRWWEDDRRGCKDDLRFLDINSIVSSRKEGSRRAQINDMVNTCLACPVYFDCLDDLLTLKGVHYGIRAGIRGKT